VLLGARCQDSVKTGFDHRRKCQLAQSAIAGLQLLVRIK
jgi:hypothetical protein